MTPIQLEKKVDVCVEVTLQFLHDGVEPCAVLSTVRRNTEIAQNRFCTCRDSEYFVTSKPVHPLKHVWYPDCISSSYYPDLGFECFAFLLGPSAQLWYLASASIKSMAEHSSSLSHTLTHSHTFSHILTHSYTFTISNSFTFHKWAHVIVTLGALTHWLPDNPQHRMWQMRSSHEARSIQEAPNT